MSVEFTYLMAGAVIIAPNKVEWPAVVSFWVRTPLTPERIEAGFVFQCGNSPSLSLGLEVTRSQFTDVMWLLREKIMKDFHFTVSPGSDDHWPIIAWGASFVL